MLSQGLIIQDRLSFETYRRALEDRVAGSFEAFYPEPLNVWLSVEARPSDAGGIIIFFRNITQQRAAAEELQRKTEEAERQAAEIETVTARHRLGWHCSIQRTFGICD